MEKYWQTADANIFRIGGKNIQIAKRGRAQAEQIAALNQWLKEHMAPLAENVKEQDVASGWQLFMAMAGELSADAQLELAKMLVGKSDTEGNALPDNFVDEHYDIDWVVEALQIAGRGAAAQRILTSFFTNVG